MGRRREQNSRYTRERENKAENREIERQRDKTKKEEGR